MPVETARVGIPEGFELEEGGGSLRIHRRWPRLAALPIAIFTIAWDGFLIAWYSGAATRESTDWIMLLFPIGHVAVGLFLPYLAVAFLLNSTHIEVEQGELTVSHRPLPFPGSRRISARDVRQLFSVERRARKGGISYDVMVQLASEREIKLVSHLTSEREARFVEQRIESRLGLADRPVSGELPR